VQEVEGFEVPELRGHVRGGRAVEARRAQHLCGSATRHRRVLALVERFENVDAVHLFIIE